MSVQETKEDLSDEAYKVVEATNSDGTVDGEIINTDREEDDLVLKIQPLVPSEDIQEFRLDWPSKDTEDYAAVRLCRQKVGGFQAVGQLEGERIRLDDTDGSWNIITPSVEDGWIRTPSTKGTMVTICGIGFSASLIGVAVPIILLFLVPFGITLLTFWQGLSIFMLSVVILFATGAALDALLDD